MFYMTVLFELGLRYLDQWKSSLYQNDSFHFAKSKRPFRPLTPDKTIQTLKLKIAPENPI